MPAQEDEMVLLVVLSQSYFGSSLMIGIARHSSGVANFGATVLTDVNWLREKRGIRQTCESCIHRYLPLGPRWETILLA